MHMPLAFQFASVGELLQTGCSTCARRLLVGPMILATLTSTSLSRTNRIQGRGMRSSNLTVANRIFRCFVFNNSFKPISLQSQFLSVRYGRQ